jgi:glutathione S-transferase
MTIPKLENSIAGFDNAPMQEAFERKRQELTNKFFWIEQSLTHDGYFAGERFSLVDAAYGAIFRYFDVFDRMGEFGIFANTPRVRDWRQLLQARPAIKHAVTEDDPQRLKEFLRQRNSYFSTLVAIL